MKIINSHNKISGYIDDYITQVMNDALQMVVLLDNLNKKNDRSVALHHAQVSDDPMNFFVLSAPCSQLFDNQRIILNPVILDRRGKHRSIEGCLSFPFRGEKSVIRASEVDVSYSLPMVDQIIQRTLTGFAAIVFQHETEHGKGINIYQKK